jgi:AcrR family transcriptional regulator
MACKLDARLDDILAAAVGLLSSGGMAALTTTALADAAHCSKKTIYALFPDKDRLLAAIVQRQAETVARELEGSFGDEAQTQAQAREAAIRLGAALLDLLLSPASIAINQAAASDASGHLGEILRSNGRDRLAPAIARLLGKAIGTSPADSEDLFPLYYGLLFADRQVAAIIGAKLNPMNEKARRDQAERALDNLASIAGASRSHQAPDRPDKASRQ